MPPLLTPYRLHLPLTSSPWAADDVAGSIFKPQLHAHVAVVCAHNPTDKQETVSFYQPEEPLMLGLKLQGGCPHELRFPLSKHGVHHCDMQILAFWVLKLPLATGLLHR